MEINYRITHTAFPDGDVVKYTDGMSRPQVATMDHVMKQALFNAIVKKGRKKSAKIITMNTLQSSATSMYAVK